MRETTVSESLLNKADEQLETAPTLVTLVHIPELTRILQNKDYEYFEGREYDPEPIARALLCRELGRLSWK
ncbi:hypothetical protein [Halocatena pleomorpha]|uniref:Uncharacterized protein n=1 Tax=Halocatena pleomorpha TaxID=1785090 RepID=A0A3P3RKK9_9EURY|nr:hypothetical protein [Halocatena pleomorpha]RRJ34051.1 hypothetical protein EIK79_00645 [Halocatena pleomorpha]